MRSEGFRSAFARQESWARDLLETDEFRSALARQESWAETMVDQHGENSPSAAVNNEPLDMNDNCEIQRAEAIAKAAEMVQQKLGYDPIQRTAQKREEEQNMEGGRANRYKICKPSIRQPEKVSLRAEITHRMPPSYSYKTRKVDLGGDSVNELMEGVIVSDEEAQTIREEAENACNDDYIHTTRCSECLKWLKVKRMASLVYCPDCKIISPNSSTQ